MTKQTKIYFLEGVPLDSSYKNTIYFLTREAQTNYFLGKAKFSMLDCTFQRQEQRIRVNRPVSDCYHINYLMWQNTSYSTKWFYAFVNRVEYINDGCTWIYFQIDVLQTYHFNYKLGYCYVDRMHSVTDTIGGNLEPEPVQTGEYLYSDYQGALFGGLEEMAFLVMVLDLDTTGGLGNLYDGIFSAAQIKAFRSDDVSNINVYLDSFSEKPDAVLAIYTCPMKLIGAIPDEGLILPRTAKAKRLFSEPSFVNGTQKLDGYLPRNKKLYTYPYNFYYVSNASGSSLTLRYEFFESNAVELEASGTITMPVQLIVRPYHYKNTPFGSIQDEPDQYMNELITLSSYPLCSWGSDTYKAWTAQNSLPMIGKLAQSGVSGALGASLLGANPAFGLATMGMQALSNLTASYQASIQADVSRGSISSANVNVSTGSQNFYGGRMSITAEKAALIDAFFDRFGYAVNRFMEPVRNARKVWTYLKCSEVNLLPTTSGNLGIPAPYQDEIRNAYLSGVTWWKSGDQVGHYELDNTVGGD